MNDSIRRLNRLTQIGIDLCETLNIDWRGDPNVQDTPRRFAGFWQEFIEYRDGKTDKTFDNPVETSVGQWVVVSGIRVYSVCEHHLLPFWADVTIGVQPNGRVLGLSKFARIAHKEAHKPNTQEGLANGILAAIRGILGGDHGVFVHATGVHLCMVMRGIKTDGQMTTVVQQNVDLETIANLVKLAKA